MTLLFNGGFLKPFNPQGGYTITSNIKSDSASVYAISEQGKTKVQSKLVPKIEDVDSTSSLSVSDPTTVEIFLDSTTRVLPASPGFIESSPDDYHPFPAIEYTESRFAGFGDYIPRTPHFVVKPDSTSQYYGKDRYDNFMTEALTSFGDKFRWFGSDLNTLRTTFNGGSLGVTQGGLHMAFTYLKAPDMTYYGADLYYSKYSDADGTFKNPVLLESNLDYGDWYQEPFPSLVVKPFNRKTNPRFINVQNTGLFLATLRTSYNVSKDATDYYLDLKLSRDDGTTWSDYSRTPFQFYIEDPNFSGGSKVTVYEQHSTQMHWAYAENKMVCLFEFRNATTFGADGLDRINIAVSNDLGRSFQQFNIDLNKVIGKLFANTTNTAVYYAPGTLYYDPKISRFVIVVGVNITKYTSPYSIGSGFVLLVNRGNDLNIWDPVIIQNTSDSPAFKYSGTTDYNFCLSHLSNRYQYNQPVGSRIISCVDENNICWTVMHGGLSYKKTNNAAFDSYADYSGNNSAVAGDLNFAWHCNPYLVSFELTPSTDSNLNQFRFSNIPWRARKFSGRGTSHNNTNNTVGLYGATISAFYDAIINNNNELQNANYPTGSDLAPYRNRTFIHSMVSYKNNLWMLAGEHVNLPSAYIQENRSMTFQIPMLITRPTWSNVNIKPRKIHYFTPARYWDNSFFGWEQLTTTSGQQISLSLPPNGRKYYEMKFQRESAIDALAPRCGLYHYGGAAAFVGRRGAMWDADSTRGVFAHFICSNDAGLFTSDITSMVHAVSISPSPGSGVNMSTIQTWVGKNFIAIQSSGSTTSNKYQVFPGIDTTRNMEFLVIANRFKSFDTTHEHRMFFKYEGAKDWTFMYFTLLTSGSSLVFSHGIAMGNLMRWPTVVAGDATNCIFFKYHSEGWSAKGMTDYYPTGVSGVLTPSADNKIAVLPQPCLHAKTFLPKDIQITWSGQDATCGTVFNLKKAEYKNTPEKMLDFRPNIGFKSLDGTTPYSLLIDFGQPMVFDSVALYNHNLMTAKFSYSQINPSSDLTQFLVHWNANLVDATDYRTRNVFPADTPTHMSIVDSNTLLVYNQDFLKYVQNNNVIGQIFQFNDSVFTKRIVKKCMSAEVLNDSSVYLQFQIPTSDLWLVGGTNNFNLMNFVGGQFCVLKEKHFYVLNKTITARWIKIEDVVVNSDESAFKSYRSTFDGTHQSNFDGNFQIGSLHFGMFQQTENPVQNNFKTTLISPSSLEAKFAGAPVSVQVAQQSYNRFNVEFQSAYDGNGEQADQIRQFVKYIGGNRDPFYFTPRQLTSWDGLRHSVYSDTSVYGFKSYTTDFYFVRLLNNPQFKQNGNLVSLSLSMEEVI
jgi:hypothetical protein